MQALKNKLNLHTTKCQNIRYNNNCEIVVEARSIIM